MPHNIPDLVTLLQNSSLQNCPVKMIMEFFSFLFSAGLVMISRF